MLMRRASASTRSVRSPSPCFASRAAMMPARVRRAVCSGSRAAEMALRLKYAGVREDRLLIEPDLPRALERATDDAANPRVFALPTYTAMLALREELVDRGAAKGSFG